MSGDAFVTIVRGVGAKSAWSVAVEDERVDIYLRLILAICPTRSGLLDRSDERTECRVLPEGAAPGRVCPHWEKVGIGCHESRAIQLLETPFQVRRQKVKRRSSKDMFSRREEAEVVDVS